MCGYLSIYLSIYIYICIRGGDLETLFKDILEASQLQRCKGFDTFTQNLAYVLQDESCSCALPAPSFPACSGKEISATIAWKRSISTCVAQHRSERALTKQNEQTVRSGVQAGAVVSLRTSHFFHRYIRLRLCYTHGSGLLHRHKDLFNPRARSIWGSGTCRGGVVRPGPERGR